MSSRSSLQRSSLSSNKSSNSNATPVKAFKSNIGIEYGSGARKDGDSSNSKKDKGSDPEMNTRRPSTSWSLWNYKGDKKQEVMDESKEVEQTHASWWKKPSLIPMSLVGMDSHTNNTENSEENLQAPLDKDNSTRQDSNDTNDTNSKTTWIFWNKRDEPKEVMKAKEYNTLSNEVLPGEEYDAILFKTKSDDQTANKTEVTNSYEVEGHNLNLLVPSFQVLPSASLLSSIYSQIIKIGAAWNPENLIRVKHQSLYKRNPQISLNELSEGKTRPVRVLIVGVHGFFPTKMIRPIIGEPTGTSTKFISEAERAILRWFHKNDTQVEISKIALEKEGKVLDRVEFFFDVLKKWINEINNADFVYFVAHSQGCPVTVMLLAKLIETGIIDIDTVVSSDAPPISMSVKRKKKIISILAMAGVNNGPFYGADQTFFVKAYSAIESDSLKELFEFQNFRSVLSQKYIQSLRICIASNVKISYVGSINDQLVPLYSSTCQFAHHPNIFKATFVDRDSRTPAFITRIVSIANNLINLGFDDHGIIKEISASLAGTLTGGGHSKIYNEGQVYELGIQFALETTDLPVDVPVLYKAYEVDQLDANPYHLPWCMRGLLYETGIHLGRNQIDSLFAEFEEWEPETKQLKNVKYRLNGLKSKL